MNCGNLEVATGGIIKHNITLRHVKAMKTKSGSPKIVLRLAHRLGTIQRALKVLNAGHVRMRAKMELSMQDID